MVLILKSWNTRLKNINNILARNPFDFSNYFFLWCCYKLLIWTAYISFNNNSCIPLKYPQKTILVCNYCLFLELVILFLHYFPLL